MQKKTKEKKRILRLKNLKDSAQTEEPLRRKNHLTTPKGGE